MSAAARRASTSAYAVAAPNHQKLVVVRQRGQPQDLAFVGGIDLCHFRRDDARHEGDPQIPPLDKRYGAASSLARRDGPDSRAGCSTWSTCSPSAGTTPPRSTTATRIAHRSTGLLTCPTSPTTADALGPGPGCLLRRRATYGRRICREPACGNSSWSGEWPEYPRQQGSTGAGGHGLRHRRHRAVWTRSDSFWLRHCGLRLSRW